MRIQNKKKLNNEEKTATTSQQVKHSNVMIKSPSLVELKLKFKQYHNGKQQIQQQQRHRQQPQQ